MSSANAPATRNRLPQPGSLIGEKPKPGIDGSTRCTASSALPPCATGSVSGPTTCANSTNELGQPCTISSGRAVGSAERMCTKWIGWPSTSVTYCGSSFSSASALRQSKVFCQYSAIRRR